MVMKLATKISILITDLGLLILWILYYYTKNPNTGKCWDSSLCLNICLLVELFFACAKSVLVCAFADDTTGHNHIVSHIFVLIVS